MSSTLVTGKGVTLGYAATTSYTTVAHMSNDLKPPQINVSKIEVPAYDTADTFMPKIPSWLDSEDAEFTIYYTDTQAATLYGLCDGLSVFHWKITFLDGSTLIWDGFVSHFGTETPLKEVIKNTIKITVNTKPVFVSGS